MNGKSSGILLTIVLTVCGLLPASAQDTPPGDEIWYTSSNDEIIDIDPNNNATVYVPETYAEEYAGWGGLTDIVGLSITDYKDLGKTTISNARDNVSLTAADEIEVNTYHISTASGTLHRKESLRLLSLRPRLHAICRPPTARQKDTRTGFLELNLGHVTLYPSQETTFTMQSAYDDFVIGGNYQARKNNGYWYTLNTSGNFQLMKSGLTLKAQRFWLTFEERSDGPYYHDEVYVPSADGIYNLQGQRVTTIESGRMYIVNGKKYIAE